MTTISSSSLSHLTELPKCASQESVTAVQALAQYSLGAHHTAASRNLVKVPWRALTPPPPTTPHLHSTSSTASQCPPPPTPHPPSPPSPWGWNRWTSFLAPARSLRRIAARLACHLLPCEPTRHPPPPPRRLVPGTPGGRNKGRVIPLRPEGRRRASETPVIQPRLRVR